jgi:hypothetical protein
MGLIAFAGGKGSPGVTTAALALAAVWPWPVMVAECDPAGSDLAYRLHTAGGTPFQHEPSLLSLAGASRRPAPGQPAARAEAHCQMAAGGVPVLRGPLSPEQAVGLEPYWPAIAAALAAAPVTVLADVGRLHPDNAALPVVAAADVVVLVGRASVEGLAHLRDRVEQAALAGRQSGSLRLVAVIVSEGTRGEQAVRHAAEVLAQTGIPVRVAGWLALDTRGVEAVAGGIRPRRSPLLRTARSVAAALLAALGTGEEPEFAATGVSP